MEAGGGEGFKAAPDFLFCCWKLNFPCSVAPKRSHCIAGLHMGGYQQDTAARSPSLASVVEAWIGGRQQDSPGAWCCCSFPTPKAHQWAATGTPKAHQWAPAGTPKAHQWGPAGTPRAHQWAAARGPQASPGSCTGGGCSQLGSEDPTSAVARHPLPPKRGHLPSVPLGSVPQPCPHPRALQDCGDGSGGDAQCVACPPRKFKDRWGHHSCKPCLSCALINRLQKSNCTATADAVCGECLPG